jgi:hypothetical protein
MWRLGEGAGDGSSGTGPSAYRAARESDPRLAPDLRHRPGPQRRDGVPAGHRDRLLARLLHEVPAPDALVAWIDRVHEGLA